MVNIIKYKGLTIISNKIKGESVSVMIMVNVGSNQETTRISGASHFLEHMMFDTKNRSSIEITSEIEKVGGIINAYTAKNRTAYFGKVPKRYFKTLVDVLADVIKNPKFDMKEIKKEKKVVIAETKMTFDNPKLYQFLLMEKTLFKKHPAKNPTLGNPGSIKNLTRNNLINYYNRYYKTENMVVCIVGNFDNLDFVKKSFGDLRSGGVDIRYYKEPIQDNIRILVKKKNILHSYIGIGYHAPNRVSKDSYVFDIIETILGYGLSSKLGIEIREKRGLAYQVGAIYEAGKDFGYLVIHLSTDKKNTELVKRLILNEVDKLKDISNKELEDAKRSIGGQFLLENEDGTKFADTLARWYLLKDVRLAKDYIKNIRKVSVADIKRVINKYMGKDNYSFVVLKQE